MSLHDNRREERALVRFALIEELLDSGLTEDGRRLVFARLMEEGVEIEGVTHCVTRSTLYRYLADHREGGFSALLPKVRSDAGGSRAIPANILERAIDLRRLQKERETRHVIKRLEQLFRSHKGRIHRSTLDRHLALAGMSRRQLGVVELKVFKRFEADVPNARWIGDVMHGEIRVVVPGRSGLHKAYLISWIDDHSRYLTHSEWYLAERLPSLEDCFKKAVFAHGLPDQVYTDLGSIYIARAWLLALAELDVRRVRTRAYAKEARGKIEKFHQTARSFEREVLKAGINTLAELNEAWWAYLRLLVHERTHKETGELPAVRYQKPIERRYPDHLHVARLFLMREDRKVNVKFSTVSVRGVDFRVDPLLRGRKVQVRFDPYSLDRVYIWHSGREVEVARPASNENMPARPENSPEEPNSLVVRSDARDFLAGLVDEAREKQRQALPGLVLTNAASPSGSRYGWTAFTQQLSQALGRAFEDFTQPEQDQARQVWRDHGPLQHHFVQAALLKAIATKGCHQHLAYYLDQIKMVHFNDALDAGRESKKQVPGSVHQGKGEPVV